jgi:hypothetical protein
MKNFLILGAVLPIATLFFLQSCSNSEDNVDPCSSGPSISIVDIIDAVGSESNGRITVSGSGGSGGLRFSIDGQNFVNTSQFSNLTANNYTVTVQDEAGCENSITAVVNSVRAISFSEDILPILETNCMISSCHCDGNSLCFDTYEVVSAYAEGIGQRTASRNMPPAYSGKSLTDAEISQIAAWIDQGVKDN